MNTSAAKSLRRFFGPAYGHGLKRAWKSLSRRERWRARRSIEATQPLAFSRGTTAEQAVDLLLAKVLGPARNAVIVLTAPLRPEPVAPRTNKDGAKSKTWKAEQRALRAGWRKGIAAARRALT